MTIIQCQAGQFVRDIKGTKGELGIIKEVKVETVVVSWYHDYRGTQEHDPEDLELIPATATFKNDVVALLTA